MPVGGVTHKAGTYVELKLCILKQSAHNKKLVQYIYIVILVSSYLLKVTVPGALVVEAWLRHRQRSSRTRREGPGSSLNRLRPKTTRNRWP